MRNIAGEPAGAVDRDGLRDVAGVINDFDLTRLDDMELEVSVADREECFSIPIGFRRDLETLAQFGDLGLIERREGNGLKIMFRHSNSLPWLAPD
jgi:hypothetical protein